MSTLSAVSDRGVPLEPTHQFSRVLEGSVTFVYIVD